MIVRTEGTIEKYNMISAGQCVVCGLSGGADSVAMTHILLKLSEKMKFRVCAAHLNHMIRGEEADRDELFVRDFCEKNKIPLYTGRKPALSYALSKGMSIEEGARELRYKFFEEAKERFSAQKIATAHNADDNLETIIFNLTRGTGLSGLCGIPPVRGDIIRPLILSQRNQIIEYIEENKLSYITDSTNECTDYSRNRIRHYIIPEIKKINPMAAATAAYNSDILRNDNAFINETVNSIVERYCSFDCDTAQIETSVIDGMHEAVKGRVLMAMINRLIGAKDFGRIHIEEISALICNKRKNVRASLPKGLTAVNTGKQLIIGKINDVSVKISEQSLPIGKSVFIPEAGLVVMCEKTEKNNNVYNLLDTFLINYDKINGELKVRSRKEGDKISLPGRNVTKTLKKLMIELGIPREKRDCIPVISDDDGVVAVYGIGCDKNRQSKAENINNLCITIRSEKDNDDR